MMNIGQQKKRCEKIGILYFSVHIFFQTHKNILYRKGQFIDKYLFKFFSYIFYIFSKPPVSDGAAPYI